MPKPRGPGKPIKRINATKFLKAELSGLRAAGARKSFSRDAFVSIQWSNHLIDSMLGVRSKRKQATKRAGAQYCKIHAEILKSKVRGGTTTMQNAVRFLEEAILEVEALSDFARGRLSPENLDAFENNKQDIYAALEEFKAMGQDNFKIELSRLEKLSSLAQSVLKWSLGEELFAEYIDELTKLRERVSEEH